MKEKIDIVPRTLIDFSNVAKFLFMTTLSEIQIQENCNA